MTRTVEARLVRLEGINAPCVILSPHGEVPEELVVNFSASEYSEVPKSGPTTYRLEPSSSHDAEPLYRELFDE